MKWLEHAHKPEKITITTVVHIPTLADYWAESLDVLKLCLGSLLDNTRPPFDLMIFDNDSCEEVRAYLLSMQRSGAINYLILADENHRKLGALNFLLAAAPGEIVSFTDSDVYFRAGWLEASLAVLNAFPEAGQVTALPTADKTAQYCLSTLKGIEGDSDLAVQRGSDLIPEAYLRAHALSLGEPWEDYQKRLSERMDVLIQREGTAAYVSAQDFQFTMHKALALPFLPLTEYSADEFYDPLHSPVLEARLDAEGYWRLSTTKYYAHHMGNRVPAADELEQVFGYELEPGPGQPVAQKPVGRVGNRFVRRLLKKINTVTYSLLYE